MSDTVEVKDKIKLTEGDNVIANTKDVCNVFNEYFITIAKDMNELHHIDFDGPLDNILSAYQNHPSDIQWRHTVNDEQSEFHALTQVDTLKQVV